MNYITIEQLMQFSGIEGRAKPYPLYGYELSNTMVRKVHMLLHQALDVAVKEQLIVRNPTDGTCPL